MRAKMELLDRTIDQSYPDLADGVLARVGDLQGFGSRQNQYIAESDFFARKTQETTK